MGWGRGEWRRPLIRRPRVQDQENSKGGRSVSGGNWKGTVWVEEGRGRPEGCGGDWWRRDGEAGGVITGNTTVPCCWNSSFF